MPVFVAACGQTITVVGSDVTPDAGVTDSGSSGELDATTIDTGTSDSSIVGTPCGGPSKVACPSGQYCSFAISDSCGSSTQMGVCAPIPLAASCPATVQRVCGCDQVTYDNECLNRAAGISVGANSECPTSSTMCGGIAGIQCKANTFCDIPLAKQCGAADEAGLCEPKPLQCPAASDPVCGCNGVTYDNTCVAHVAGAAVKKKGAC